ncbi:DUF222 domain-containing protein [Ilumatobacter coccineus]|uniref:DUF222 domain-containing protein n=1 Tax=Ilumatobacter coccineus (strain NBRC 103263 / KCTC 29153 / YM16-304) TaxID=1313172 RepID=A0A6C7EAG9_ILUCY|nr:DUF222 domain-containing protein [Ilumatobacter coccineus]BAN03461.1 hypothetical protein YM304_31470 [Ilumatobacter coccineus YM16-304]
MLIEELAECSPRQLDAALAEAELDRRRAEARISAVTALISARGGYRDHGYRSMRTYLKGQLNCSGSAANKIRRRADAMNLHPTVGEALLAGRVGSEQVDLLAKAASHPVAGDRFAEFEPQLLDHAEHLEYRDFDTVIGHFITQADPDGSFDSQRFHEDERTAWVADINGSVDVHASGGSPLAAAEMKAIFDAAVEAEFHADCAARRAEHGDNAHAMPLPRTLQQRKFDALHNIFLASVTAPVDGKAPEPLVNIVIDHVTAGRVLAAHGLTDTPNLLGLDDTTFDEAHENLLDRHCTIGDTPIHPDDALTAMITGRVRRAIVDADRVTIDLGRSQRLFTGKARDAAQLLATTCTHRGCDIPAKLCDIDHRAEWASDGGPTDQRNAMPLCGAHDRWKHTNHIRTRRAANGRIYLIRPDGSTIKPVGETEPDWAEPHPHAPSDPFARFGRPLTLSELTGRPVPPTHEWTIHRIDFNELRTR